jgi:ATP-dependent DNA helicase RecG
MIDNPLAKSLRGIGVSEKTAETLLKNHIETVFDLLLRVPKSIVEQVDSPGFLYMEAGRHYVVDGTVLATKVTGVGSRRRLEAILQDETGRMSAVFFGPAVVYAQKLLKQDATVTLAGEAKDFLGRIQMVHPKFITTQSQKEPPAALSTYAQIGGIASASFKKVVGKVLLGLKKSGFLDHAPKDVLARHAMAPLAHALLAIHEPVDAKNQEWDQRKSSPNFRRLAFEELINFYVRLNKERRIDTKQSGVMIKPAEISELIANFLPFTLTKAQERVVGEIISDMVKPNAMTRLVQGDVGSGKTAVSAVVARHVINASLQAAVMAPTEILAEQLFLVYQGFFKQTTARLALLTAHTKPKDRKIILEGIKNQTYDIVVGTHALLSEGVQFGRLGLVIIDEQHRFGVKQRAELLTVAANYQNFNPHLLVMSATPIPRSLALTFYGDLELSVIDERPAGRLPIHTQILTGAVLDSVQRLCERIIATKQKAFIVFPLIEESESLDLENATKAVAILQTSFGPESSMLLHGKMKPEEKALAMARFRDNHISFLVATTVVEVGIDIPDATCMIIVHPERFGLAQLHQLRGRVGRKNIKSFCFLVTDLTNKFGTAFKRLDALCKHDNGFRLAEIDLEIRGPGELLGTKQSGLPNFLVFNHLDFADLLTPAKAYAKTITEHGLKAEYLHLYPTQKAHFS